MTTAKVLAAAAGAAVLVGAARAGDVPWRSAIPLDSTALGAVGVAVGDIDNDGAPDVVAISASDNTIAWYENGGNGHGGYFRREISADMRGPQRVALADLDRDGWLDIVVTCAADGAVRVLMNDRTPRDGGWLANPWVVGQGAVKGLALGDFDHDGDLDVAFSVPGSNRVAWLENDGSPRTGPATLRTISTTDAANDLACADLDRDGFPDLVAANGPGGASGSGVVWWANDQSPANGGWTRTVVANGQPSPLQCIAAQDVNGDGRPDLVAGRLDGTILWYRSTGPGAFTSATLGAGATDPRSIAVGDLDGDSDPDVAVACFSSDSVRWFENLGGLSPSFTPRTVAGSYDGASAVALADLDHDGDPDAAVAAFNAGDVVVVPNAKIHSSSRFEPFQVLNSEPQANGGPNEDIWAVDLDNDGDVDLVRVVNRDNQWSQVWYEHDPTPFSGPWTKRTIQDPDPDISGTVWILDADGDGAPDLGSEYRNAGLDDNCGYLLNDGSPADGGWTLDADRVGTVNYFSLSGFGDLDADGYPDALLNHFDLLGLTAEIYWDQYDPHAVVAWNRRRIDVDGPIGQISKMATADLDRDGDQDIILLGPGNSTSFLENPGTTSGVFTRRTLPTLAASYSPPALADFNHDGLPDIMTFGGSDAVICRNAGGTPPTFAASRIGQTPYDHGFNDAPPHVCDMDRDGDLDVVVPGNDDQHATWAAVFECTDAAALAFATTPLQGPPGESVQVDFADLDRDGLADLVGVGIDQAAGLARMFIMRNRGGQAIVSGASTIPPGAGIYEARESAMLTLDVSHLGRPADHAAEIAEVRVLFEQLPGLPLTPSQVQNLFSSVAIYRDVDGDGLLTPGLDIQVDRAALTAHFAENPVRLTISDGLAEAQIPATQTRRYIIAAALTPDAHAAPLHQFTALVRLDEDRGPLGIDLQDAAADLPLRLAHSRDARTGVVSALCRADFNGDGFLDFFDYDDLIQCFEIGLCPPGNSADFNNDGFADFFDYDDFVNAFQQGC